MVRSTRWNSRVRFSLLGAVLIAALFATRNSRDSAGVLSRNPAGIMGTECQLRVAVDHGREKAAESALEGAEAALRRV